MDYVELRDISVYQWFRNPNGTPILTDPVDFSKMVGQKVKGVYIRAMTCRGEEDYAFRLNWELAKQAGLLRGAYGFTSPTEPLTFANKFTKIILSTGDTGELPPWLDYEDVKIVPKPPRPTAAATRLWLDRVEQNYRRPMIYTSHVMWFDPIPPTWTNDYRLAVANYTTSVLPTLPHGWKDYCMHQYSNKGDGIANGVKSKEIDCDRIRQSDWKLLTGQTVDQTDQWMVEIDTWARTQGYNGIKPFGD
jgi:GH25 family lysozyme M1 (1,4-beta-N-acetylmuramidase)